MTTCEAVQLELGAYVLGGLSPAERAAVDRHVFDCPACAAELTELEDAALLLARITASDLDGNVTGPDELARRRRPRRLLVAASAAAAVLALVVGVAVEHSGHPATVFTASSAGVTISAQVHDQPGGTALNLVVAGLPTAEHCTLVAISTTGARESAGRWTADYDHATRVVETSSFSSTELASLELDGSDGRQLVRVPVN